jgi:glucokinase
MRLEAEACGDPEVAATAAAAGPVEVRVLALAALEEAAVGGDERDAFEAVARQAELPAGEARAAAEREPDSALGRMAAEGETIDGKAVTEAALAGDRASIGVFDLIGSRLGVALTTFANIFEPEVFVIGGGVMAAGDLLLEPARRELRERALPPMKGIPVLAAEMGPDAGMIGAAAMARIELEQGREG